MNRMWSRPITDERLASVAKDAARLVCRTQVHCGTTLSAREAEETTEPALFRVVLAISRAFGEGELTAVQSAVDIVKASKLKKGSPDMALVAADLITRCGGEASPTMRVLKVCSETELFLWLSPSSIRHVLAVPSPEVHS